MFAIEKIGVEMKFGGLEKGEIFRNEEGETFLRTEIAKGVTENDSRYDINAVNLDTGDFTAFAYDTIVYFLS